jgi:hypothetical protein
MESKVRSVISGAFRHFGSTKLGFSQFGTSGARRLRGKFSQWARRLIWLAFWLGLPIVFVLMFLLPTAQPPAIGSGDQTLALSFESLRDQAPMQVNLDYDAYVFPADAGSYEYVSIWWYPAERISGMGTTRVDVYAEGANNGADWSCKPGSLPPLADWGRYALEAYPRRATRNYPERIPVDASTTASIELASEEVSDDHLVTAGRTPVFLEPVTESVQPSPTPSPTVIPQEPIDVEVGIPPGASPQASIPVSRATTPTRSTYQLTCHRWLHSDITNDSEILLQTPRITLFGDAIVTSVHNTASVQFPNHWSLASPISSSSDTFDQPRAGLVTFEQHDEGYSSPVQFGDGYGDTLFGDSFVASSPDGKRYVAVVQQVGLLAGAAWLALLGGSLAPILLRWPFRKGARGVPNRWTLLPVPEQDFEDLKHMVDYRQAQRSAGIAPRLADEVATNFASDTALRAAFEAHKPWSQSALSWLAKSSTVTTARFTQVMDLCAETPEVLYTPEDIAEKLHMSVAQWRKACRRLRKQLRKTYTAIPKRERDPDVRKSRSPLVRVFTRTPDGRNQLCVGITREQARRWKSIRRNMHP